MSSSRLAALAGTLLILPVLFTLSAHAQWADGQSAARVIGQGDFVSQTQTIPTTDDTLISPDDVCVDVANSKLYVADASNNRVLRYSYPITTDQPSAELVFGQASFTTRGSGTTANTLHNPIACAVDGAGRLWVLDFSNRRLLRFDSAHTISTNQPSADGVLGQSSFTTKASGTFQNRFSTTPYDVTITSGGTVFVADRGNNRVLRFNNAAGKSNGANADRVLGQSAFTTNSTATPPTAASMNQPHGVVVDSNNRLWVADYGNNRVLRFDNVASKTDGANADGVLGQADFASNTASLTADGLKNPAAVEADASGRLYVLDFSSERILIYDDAASKSAGDDADNVLGQTDFVSEGTGLSASAISPAQTAGLAIDAINDVLWYADTNNSRVLGYQASGALPVELTAFSVVADGESVVLTWSTATETNNAGFVVEQERSGTWVERGFAEGHGTTLAAHHYRHTLNTVLPGTHRFRLKQIDYDGTFSYSPTVAITIETPHGIALRAAYPNPFHTITTIGYSVAQTMPVSLMVYDLLGRPVQVLVDGAVAAGSHEVVIEAGNLPSGTYIYRLQAGSQTFMGTLVLMR